MLTFALSCICCEITRGGRSTDNEAVSYLLLYESVPGKSRRERERKKQPCGLGASPDTAPVSPDSL